MKGFDTDVTEVKGYKDKVPTETDHNTMEV